MKRIAAMLAVVLLPAVAFGQLPSDVKVQPGRLATIEFDITGKGFAYEVLGDLDAFREFTSDTNKVRLRLIGYTQGEYWLILATVDKGATAPVINKCKITVGTPTPPVPPGPTPPGPNPPPTPVAGLRVLILYESSEESKMPKAQQLILRDPTMRTWLDSKCMDETSTRSKKAWYMVDKDANFSSLPVWQKMSTTGKGVPMPAIVIAGSDGVPIHWGPLPADVAGVQALVGKYASATPARKAG